MVARSLRSLLVFAVLLAGMCLSAVGQTDFPLAAKRIVYISDNFMHEQAVTNSIGVLRKAAAAGYNAVLITDCKFDRWSETVTVDQQIYIANLKKVRQACRDLKMEVIATCLGQGADLLANDPNLAEGMPVIDAPFLAKGGMLVPADADFPLKNASFEEAGRDPNQPAGWNVDFPGKCGFVDKVVTPDGKPSIRFEDIKVNSSYGNGRLNQSVACKPFRTYHASVMIKTENFDAPRTINIMAMNPKQCLVHQLFDVKPTQDWTKYDVIFNTLDNTEVNFYAGSWGGGKGKLWIGAIHLESSGFVNLIRRPSLTFKIASEDGKTVYVEGTDYAPVKDAKMGNAKWPGDFDYWHEAPQVTLPAGSRIRDGQTVLASYSHTMNVYGWSVLACMNEPKVMEIAKANLAMIHKVIDPDGYMLPYDEMRHQGWDDSCVKSGMTASQMLIANTRACVAAIRKEAPGKTIYAWNDMFDPTHNATKTGAAYYLVKGIDPWYGSWDGLDKDVVILNWQSDAAKRVESMKFFADRGHKQILCGYYDAPSENILPWMKDAAKIPGVSGVMYTTWANDYSQLDAFSRLARGFKAD